MGRRAAYRLTAEEDQVSDVDDMDDDGFSQTLITDFFPVIGGSGGAGGNSPPLSPLQRASRAAVTRFWCLLEDFACLQQVPTDWAALSAHHPFLRASQAGKLTVSLPPSATLPGTLF
jgi:hypothetical protein